MNRYIQREMYLFTECELYSFYFPLLYIIRLESSPLCHLVSLMPGSLTWLSPVPHPPCYIRLFNFESLFSSLLSSPEPDTAPYILPLHSPFQFSCTTTPEIILSAPQCRTEALTILWSPFLRSSIRFKCYIMGLMILRANIPLSVNTYLVRSFCLCYLPQDHIF